MGYIKNRINHAKHIIMNHLELYVTGWVILFSGILISILTGCWQMAIAAAVFYVPYEVLVDLYVLGYIPISFNLDTPNRDFTDECGSEYEEEDEDYEEVEEDELWEDEENLYSRDDDVEEEYEDENYNEDEDEFDPCEVEENGPIDPAPITEEN